MDLEKQPNTKLAGKVSEAIWITSLYQDLFQLIEKSRHHVAREFNRTLVLLNWSIGQRIHREILNQERAEYGEEIINSLSQVLSQQYGRGYSRPNLFRMVRFARIFPEQEIVSTLSRQLSWSHVLLLMQMEEPNKRAFYLNMAIIENWSVRDLKSRMNGMLFERTALSKKPEEVISRQLKELGAGNGMAPDLIFRDPCFLDFIGLKGSYSEADLEKAILDHISEFIQELGSDFCFVARQKRMSISKKDRYLDLLFFHRGMRRLIAIELKLVPFEPEHKGQMEWYLRWLDKHERRVGEEKPLGIILCSDKDQEDVEYLELDQSGIHVAQYLTELPPKEILEERLHKAIHRARELYAKQKALDSSPGVKSGESLDTD